MGTREGRQLGKTAMRHGRIRLNFFSMIIDQLKFLDYIGSNTDDLIKVVSRCKPEGNSRDIRRNKSEQR